jgi:hypothetical protein
MRWPTGKAPSANARVQFSSPTLMTTPGGIPLVLLNLFNSLDTSYQIGRYIWLA